MNFGALIPSEIWPDFAKSGICNLAAIWIFTLFFNGLMDSFQISDGHLRNLIRNLDYLNEFRGFRQIPDFGKSTPKGVGVLPAQGGGGHHLPLGNFLGPNLWSEINPTTAALTCPST